MKTALTGPRETFSTRLCAWKCVVVFPGSSQVRYRHQRNTLTLSDVSLTPITHKNAALMTNQKSSTNPKHHIKFGTFRLPLKNERSPSLEYLGSRRLEITATKRNVQQCEWMGLLGPTVDGK